MLSREEVSAVLGSMTGEFGLLARLLYGTGMRINEALQLRIKDVDFAHQALIVRAGKGGKDRVLMLPQSLVQPLKAQIASSREGVAAGELTCCLQAGLLLVVIDSWVR